MAKENYSYQKHLKEAAKKKKKEEKRQMKLDKKNTKEKVGSELPSETEIKE